ncbi:tripartite tricarboxylate transporter substrate binding protein [Roseomonas xinghualingensis]|uniref:tripartite tricarboxylate transporter substrate binding protein n=1 Tax=Roseomonas xinghualingensis TaxID=2986475 RepID=UPI0021F1AAC1|nr:tripartite tricarboxylate transporter substrate binding protein [Roseomonas sp. SXEYE001]MCV4209805.1 tripartite tricarboxylate transporter substrate binding protein [Roseomonas sp. SXEYE001]
MKMTFPISRRPALLGLAASFLTAPAVAQDRRFPDRPIELLVGFAAGGGTDVTARTFARFLEKEIGGSVVVNNRPGASGEVALAAAARARPDGHTLAITNMPGLVTLPIERSTPQFQLDDFAYVANLVSDPSAFSVPVDSPIHDFADLLARAKAAPDTITFASTGVGTDEHLALVLVQAAAGVKLTHVPFAGAGPMRVALQAKQVEVGGLNVGEVTASQNGVRMIAQGGARRSPFAQDVTTFKEAGLDVIMGSERGIVVTKDTPAAVVARLREATGKVCQDPAFIEQCRVQFTEMDYLDGPAWRTRLAEADRQFRDLWQRQRWSEA